VGAGHETAGVHEVELAARPLDLAVEAVSRDAGLVVRDGLALLGEPVEQGALADVGPADDGDEGHGAKGRGAKAEDRKVAACPPPVAQASANNAPAPPHRPPSTGSCSAAPRPAPRPWPKGPIERAPWSPRSASPSPLSTRTRRSGPRRRCCRCRHRPGTRPARGATGAARTPA